MGDNRVVVKYHSRPMLWTVDIDALFATLFDVYGDGLIVEFVEMDEREKAECEEVDERYGIKLVRERFHVFETEPPTGTRRRTDVERTAVHVGRK